MLGIELQHQDLGESDGFTHPCVCPEALLRKVFHAAAKPARRIGAQTLVLENGLGRLAVGELARFPGIDRPQCE